MRRTRAPLGEPFDENLHPARAARAFAPRQHRAVRPARHAAHTACDGRRAVCADEKASVFVNGGAAARWTSMPLVAAPAGRRPGAAALDVTDPEPLPANHPLRQCSNAFLTPHIAGLSLATAPRVTDYVVHLFEQNLRPFSGGPAAANRGGHRPGLHQKARNSSPPRPRKGRRARLGVPAQKRIGFGRVGARNMGFGLINFGARRYKARQSTRIAGLFSHYLPAPNGRGALPHMGGFGPKHTPAFGIKQAQHARQPRQRNARQPQRKVHKPPRALASPALVPTAPAFSWVPSVKVMISWPCASMPGAGNANAVLPAHLAKVVRGAVCQGNNQLAAFVDGKAGNPTPSCPSAPFCQPRHFARPRRCRPCRLYRPCRPSCPAGRKRQSGFCQAVSGSVLYFHWI